MGNQLELVATSMARKIHRHPHERPANPLAAMVTINNNGNPIGLPIAGPRLPAKRRRAYAMSVAIVLHGSHLNHGVSPISPHSAPRNSSPCPAGSLAISPGVSTRWRCVW